MCDIWSFLFVVFHLPPSLARVFLYIVYVLDFPYKLDSTKEKSSHINWCRSRHCYIWFVLYFVIFCVRESFFGFFIWHDMLMNIFYHVVQSATIHHGNISLWMKNRIQWTVPFQEQQKMKENTQQRRRTDNIRYPKFHDNRRTWGKIIIKHCIGDRWVNSRWIF